MGTMGILQLNPALDLIASAEMELLIQTDPLGLHMFGPFVNACGLNKSTLLLCIECMLCCMCTNRVYIWDGRPGLQF